MVQSSFSLIHEPDIDRLFFQFVRAAGLHQSHEMTRKQTKLSMVQSREHKGAVAVLPAKGTARFRSRLGFASEPCLKPVRPSLECRFAGIVLDSPFLLASGPATRNGAAIERGFAAGWAGAVTKTIASTPTRHVSPRLVGVRYREAAGVTVGGASPPVGLVNIELISTRTVRDWMRDIARLRPDWPGKAIIASIAGRSKRDWQELARQMERAGAHALELNLSCPHGLPDRGMGSAIGQNPKLAALCVAWVKAVVAIPVVAKLSPNVPDIALIARRLKEAGADGISAINTVRALAPLDVENLQVQPCVGGLSAYGGLSGPAVHPIALRCVHEIAQVTTEVCGIGGVSSWRQVLSFLLFGAKAVQVCTAVMRGGYGIVQGMKTGLRTHMKKARCGALPEVCGLLTSRVKKLDSLATPHGLAVRVDRRKCSGCGSCMVACETCSDAAITLARGTVRVSAARCDCCGLCIAVCRRKAIRIEQDLSMVPVHL